MMVYGKVSLSSHPHLPPSLLIVPLSPSPSIPLLSPAAFGLGDAPRLKGSPGDAEDQTLRVGFSEVARFD